MTACAHCGSEHWQPVHEAYDLEVRRQDPDLELLHNLAPPTRRASIHGFILGTLIWVLMLIPFFASDRARIRDTGLTLALVLLWVWLFLRARKQDVALTAAYKARARCAECGREPGSLSHAAG